MDTNVNVPVFVGTKFGVIVDFIFGTFITGWKILTVIILISFFGDAKLYLE